MTDLTEAKRLVASKIRRLDPRYGAWAFTIVVGVGAGLLARWLAL